MIPRSRNSSMIRAAASSAEVPIVVHPQLSSFGRLVGGIDTGEVLDFTGLCLGVEALGIAPDALVERRVDKDFKESGGGGQFPHHPTLGAKRRDKRADHNQPR